MEYHLCQNNKKQTKKETERKQRKKHTTQQCTDGTHMKQVIALPTTTTETL